MNASDVRAALDGRWPASEHVIVDEAPQDSSRQGRKLDRLVISCWRSRGLELDGVEIKVSMTDFRKELKEPAKADWWWHHVHRFWLACPTDLASKVRDELPTGWGLLACSEDQTRMVVKPEKHDPKPLPWTAVVGCLRTISGSGFNALQRQYAKGREDGFREGKRFTERRSADERVRHALDDLRARVDAFEEASGLSLDRRFDVESARRLGETVALIRKAQANPEHIVRDLDRTAQTLERSAERVRGLSSTLNGGGG